MKSKRKTDPDFWKYARSFLHEYMPKVRNLSEKSVEAYKQSLNCYLSFLKEALGIERPDAAFESFARSNLKLFLAWMREKKNYSSKTCNLRITAIKSFLKYCSEEDIALVCLYQDADKIHGLKNEKKPILYLSKNATAAILAAPGASTAKERRNRMLLILMYDSAARIQELANLTLDNLHISEKNPFITLTGKGRKTRNVPLMGKTVSHLKLYVEEFYSNFMCLSDSRPLFYSHRDGKPHALSTDTISLILKRYADEARLGCAEVPEEVHCHLIRKTRAMDLYQQGIPLPIIMQILGHESMSTTSSFYAFATVEMMYEAMAKANPAAVGEVPKWRNEKYLQALYSLD
jgi:site-specific recombinase XerD